MGGPENGPDMGAGGGFANREYGIPTEESLVETARLLVSTDSEVYNNFKERYITPDDVDGYDHICAAVFYTDNLGYAKGMVIRKNSEIDNHLAQDWLVVVVDLKTGEMVERTVMGSSITPGQDGDQVAIELDSSQGEPELSNVRFAVNAEGEPAAPDYHRPRTRLYFNPSQDRYAADQVTVGSQKYYGHGYGPEPEIRERATYSVSVEQFDAAMEAAIKEHEQEESAAA